MQSADGWSGNENHRQPHHRWRAKIPRENAPDSHPAYQPYSSKSQSRTFLCPSRRWAIRPGDRPTGRMILLRKKRRSRLHRIICGPQSFVRCRWRAIAGSLRIHPDVIFNMKSIHSSSCRTPHKEAPAFAATDSSHLHSVLSWLPVTHRRPKLRSSRPPSSHLSTCQRDTPPFSFQPASQTVLPVSGGAVAVDRLGDSR